MNQFSFREYKRVLREHLKKITVYWPPFTDDWHRHLLNQQENIENTTAELAFLIERLRKLNNSSVFEDFTPFTYDAPVPNLLTWLKVSRLHTMNLALEALKGKWEPAGNDLLRQLTFSKMGGRGNRILITNLIGKVIMRYLR